MNTIEAINVGRSPLINIAEVEGGLRVSSFSDFIKRFSINEENVIDFFDYQKVEYVVFSDTIIGIVYGHIEHKNKFDLFSVYSGIYYSFSENRDSGMDFNDYRLFFSFLKFILEETYYGRSDFSRSRNTLYGCDRFGFKRLCFISPDIVEETYSIGPKFSVSCKHNKTEFLDFY